MGRPLFSQKYSTPAIQEDPHPSADALDVPCEKWSASNQFDPDSDEFFTDALLEHFVDGPIDSPIEVDSVDEAPHVVVLESVAESNSPTSNVTYDRDLDFLNDVSDTTPIAVGADDPCFLVNRRLHTSLIGSSVSLKLALTFDTKVVQPASFIAALVALVLPANMQAL